VGFEGAGWLEELGFSAEVDEELEAR